MKELFHDDDKKEVACQTDNKIHFKDITIDAKKGDEAHINGNPMMTIYNKLLMITYKMHKDYFETQNLNISDQLYFEMYEHLQ